jgi:hypothetical protein
MARLAFGLVAALLSSAGCGGSTDEGLRSASGGSVADAGPGGSSGNGTGGTAGGGAAGGGGLAGTPSYALDDVCQKLAPKLCAASQSCCMAAGFGYDANGCQATSIAECGKNVAEVEAGSMSFDPSNIDVCFAEYELLLQKCVLGVGDFFELLATLKPCNSIFQGTRPEGASCQRDAQCAASSNPSVYVSCEQSSQQCTHWMLLDENAKCQLGDGVTAYCKPGLYCDAYLGGTPPYSGICKTATAPGKPCNFANPYELECCVGYYCNQSTGLCTTAKLGGAGCATDIECQTFECQSGKCSAQGPIVNQALCTGG